VGAPPTLARRARRVFAAPRVHRWIRSYDLEIAAADEDGVRGEWLSPIPPAPRTILYLQGGGYVSCSAATHRPITAALSRLIPARVFALDYRLAPEHPFPAALDDAEHAYRWLLGRGVRSNSLAIAGDSSGGGLALSMLLRLRDQRVPSPACAVLLSPWTDLAATGASVRGNNGICDMFRPENMVAFAVCYAPHDMWTDGAVSPLYGRLDGLPPLHIHVGQGELLRDDSVRLHKRVSAEGGASELVIYEGVFHGWHMLDGVVPEARQALTRAARFVQTAAVEHAISTLEADAADSGRMAPARYARWRSVAMRRSLSANR
jgi:monoterpene epsilon-lactone hydrolase